VSRETTAVIYTRPLTPRGWGWDTQSECTVQLRQQESECRRYAERHGLAVHSVLVAPYDSPPLAKEEVRGVGHILVADCRVVPDLGILATFCGVNDVHLHEARADAAVTNWKR
jgi:hypothetical protein